MTTFMEGRNCCQKGRVMELRGSFQPHKASPANCSSKFEARLRTEASTSDVSQPADRCGGYAQLAPSAVSSSSLTPKNSRCSQYPSGLFASPACKSFCRPK